LQSEIRILKQDNETLKAKLANADARIIELTMAPGSNKRLREEYSKRITEETETALRLEAQAQSAPCQAQAVVLETVFLGLSVKLRLRTDAGPDLLARIPLRPSDPAPMAEGARVLVGFHPEDVHVVPRG
jgi:hypothetical protein